MWVLVARERRISLLLVRDRSRRLLFHEDFRDGPRPSEPRPYQGSWPASTDDMFPLPSVWTYEVGLSAEARILELWDTTAPVVNGICADVVCSSLP